MDGEEQGGGRPRWPPPLLAPETGRAPWLVGRFICRLAGRWHYAVVLFDCRDGSGNSLVIGWQEADWRNQQRRRVEFTTRAVILCERVALPVVSLFADLVECLLARLSPTMHRAVQAEFLDGFNGAVESDPGHHLERAFLNAKRHFRSPSGSSDCRRSGPHQRTGHAEHAVVLR